ncbi:MAG: hypothetical protein ACFNKL_02315 [Treponema sp.]
MTSPDHVELLVKKVESIVAKTLNLQAENDALRTKCAELTNALSAKTEQLASFEREQNMVEGGILKALERLSSIENSILQAADNSIQQDNSIQSVQTSEIQSSSGVQAEQPENRPESVMPQNNENSLPLNDQAQPAPVPENGQFDIF